MINSRNLIYTNILDLTEYAVARDKLIAMKVLPDDPVVELTDEYWERFKEKNGE